MNVLFAVVPSLQQEVALQYLSEQCFLALKQGREVIILAPQSQHPNIEAALWLHPAESFMPTGEATAIQLMEQLPPTLSADLVFNLTDEPLSSVQCKELREFCLEDEHAKARLREKFVQYRQQGLTPTFAPAQLLSQPPR